MAVGYQHGLLFSAYGEMRVRHSYRHPIASYIDASLQPITRSPGGPADKIGARIAKRLSQTLGEEVTYSQTILDWLRSTGVLAVT